MKPKYRSRLSVGRALLILAVPAAAGAAFLLTAGLFNAEGQVVPVRATPSSAFATVTETPAFAYCCVEHEGDFEDVQLAIQGLVSESQSQNIYPTGPIMIVFYDDPNRVDPDALVYDVGFPVTPQVMPQPPLRKKVWYHTTVVRATHYGPYYEIHKTIERLMDWIDGNGYAAEGPILERYLDVAPEEPAAADLRTEIWIAVVRR